MKKQLYFYGCSWDKNNLHVTFIEDNKSDHLVPLGSTMLSLPSDLIPNDETFSALMHNREVSVAQWRVTECGVVLQAAEDKLKNLLALPSPVQESGSDDVPF